MPLINFSDIVVPTGSDEEMVFHTFRGYLAAVCNWTSALYPHPDGLLAGVADAVSARPWRARTRAGRTLTARGAEILRNGWATEVLLNSPRVLGGDDLVAFANLWAPVQAYYAVFEAFSALAMTVTGSRPLRTHAALLGWAATQVAHPASPFVVSWTARVGGPPGRPHLRRLRGRHARPPHQQPDRAPCCQRTVSARPRPAHHEARAD